MNRRISGGVLLIINIKTTFEIIVIIHIKLKTDLKSQKPFFKTHFKGIIINFSRYAGFG